MGNDLMWHGAWRRKTEADGDGRVSAIAVGVGNAGAKATEVATVKGPEKPKVSALEALQVRAEQIQRNKEPVETIRRVGRVRMKSG